MNKYNIEGNIDFYAELYKSLDIEDDKTEDDNNKCLISNKELTTYYVEMKCGHKFNYIPLYNDLVNHKQKYNGMERQGRLNVNQIRCPYCRKKQDELLPFHEELGVKKTHGVNFYDPTIKNTTHSSLYNNSAKCSYQMVSPNFDATKPESETNKKFYPCGGYYATQIKVYNSLNPSQPITYNDYNCYCYSHKKLMIKQYKAQEKEKEKIAKKQAKELEKASIKEAKEKLKLIQKAEKQKLKEEIKKSNKKIEAENVVLGPSIINNHYETVGCIQILKTGLNKGKICGCKVFSENMCKRHFSLINKE